MQRGYSLTRENTPFEGNGGQFSSLSAKKRHDVTSKWRNKVQM